MENLNFTENEKEVAKLMYDKYMNEGMVVLLPLLSKVASKHNIVSFETKAFGSPEVYFTSINSDPAPSDVAVFISAINFLKKLIDEKLIYPVTKSKDPTFIRKIGIYGLPKTHETFTDNSGKIKIREKKTGKEFECNCSPFNITDDLFSLLEKDCYFVLDSKLLHYIENDFKTDEEIRFEKQMKTTKRQTTIALWTAIVTGILNFVAIAANIYVACNVPITIKDDNINSLRQSIESTKSVKVDTVTVKQVAIPVTNQNEKTNK